MSTVAKSTFAVKLAPLSFDGQPEGSKLGRMSGTLQGKAGMNGGRCFGLTASW